MPNVKLTNLASYRAYFEAIAIAHKEIQGFKWGNTDVVRNDNRSDISPSFLWAMPYDIVNYDASHTDNVLKAKKARVAFMVVPDSTLFADEDTAFDYAEAVIEQIMSKIYLDKSGHLDTGGADWSLLVTRIASWSSSPVEKKLGSTKYIGWELEIEFMDNTDLEYDPTKWNS